MKLLYQATYSHGGISTENNQPDVHLDAAGSKCQWSPWPLAVGSWQLVVGFFTMDSSSNVRDCSKADSIPVLKKYYHHHHHHAAQLAC